MRVAECVCDEIITLAREDPHLGVSVLGFSPLLAARYIRQRCIGYTRNPATALRELRFLRQVALDGGYPEQALWVVWSEAELQYTLGSSGGLQSLAQTAARLAEPLGIGNEVNSTQVLCFELACAGQWQSLLDAAGDMLRLMRERSAMRPFESGFLALIGAAQLALGNPEAGCAAAAEGVAFLRSSQSVQIPHSYAVVARAQLELEEPAADISNTLDEYAALLERTGFHLYEGELYELRARLAEREGYEAEKAAALQRAYDYYTRFGMTPRPRG